MTEIDSGVVAEIGELAGGEMVAGVASKGIDWQRYARGAAVVLGVVAVASIGYATYQHFWGDAPEDVAAKVKTEAAKAQAVAVKAEAVAVDAEMDAEVAALKAEILARRASAAAQKNVVTRTRITAETQPNQ